MLKWVFHTLLFLIGIRDSRHSAHDAKDVVVHGIHTHLGRGGTRDRRGREHKLEHGVINTGEVARATWLVLLGAEGERVNVDARVGGAGVVLEGLHHVKVGTLTLREAVLAVELEFGRDARVITPAVHVKRRLGKHERAGIGKARTRDRRVGGTKGSRRHRGRAPLTAQRGARGRRHVNGTGHLEETVRGNDTVDTRHLGGATKRVDGVGEGIESIRVVERLGTQRAVERLGGVQRRAVVHVGVRLDNPDELLARVVEVQLDLVRRGTDRLVTRELELLEEVLVGVLRHLAALVRVEEDVVDVERRRHQRLLVSRRDGQDTRGGREAAHRPQALANGAEIQVDLNFVILYITYTLPFGIFIGILIFINHIYNMRTLPGIRLYLKSSQKLIRFLRPITI